MPPSISNAEFARALGRVRPPKGWPSAINIAFSGGADSTCLLFLLHRLLNSLHQAPLPSPSTDLPDPLHGLSSARISTVSVDHAFQSSSAQMARLAGEYAESLASSSHIQVKHSTIRIPWGETPFPRRPSAFNGDALEEIARKARYHVLLQDILANSEKESQLDLGGRGGIILFGHHADDQVETAIMRLSKGSGHAGLGGMRALRRWGMGESSGGELGWAGLDGMNVWIGRPLLDFTKSRILATCAEHSVPFQTDETNFQPALTVRNAVRDTLSRLQTSASLEMSPTSENDSLIADGMVKRGIEQAQKTLSMSCPSETKDNQLLLRWAAHHRELLETNERKVTNYLASHTLPSPSSTLLLVPPLSGINSPLLSNDLRQLAIIRILRYVSPKPWGSIEAESGRKTNSLRMIAERVWDESPSSCTPFTAGSEVQWTPVWWTPSSPLDSTGQGRIRFDPPPPDEKLVYKGWLASRLPPPLKNVSRGRGPVQNPTRKAEIPLIVDITNSMIKNIGSDMPITCLFDHRFSISIVPSRLPGDIRSRILAVPASASSAGKKAKIAIVPSGRYFLPKVILSYPASSDVKEEEGKERYEYEVLWDTQRNKSGLVKAGRAAETEGTEAGAMGKAENWIDVSFVRSLDSI